MALRILHRFTLAGSDEDLVAALIDQARATRALPGCLEAEAYRGVGDTDEVAVVQLWEDEAAHDTYAASVAAGDVASVPSALADFDRVRTEAYSHEYASPVDGTWAARSQQREARIVWPARDGVRIIIQSCFADPDAEVPGLLDNQHRTRREPGCIDFTWLRGTENPQHILLTELWSSQRLYDQHWTLRQRTASGGAATRQRAERTFGTNGAEFYRPQAFRLHYGRWLPADETSWSGTVAWPAS